MNDLIVAQSWHWFLFLMADCNRISLHAAHTHRLELQIHWGGGNITNEQMLEARGFYLYRRLNYKWTQIAITYRKSYNKRQQKKEEDASEISPTQLVFIWVFVWIAATFGKKENSENKSGETVLVAEYVVGTWKCCLRFERCSDFGI